MSSAAILEGKKAIVSEIAEKMKKSASFVVVDYKGIDVTNVTALRAKAREMGVEYKIYKNTFLRFAAKECGYDELVDVLKGSTAIAFCEDDPIAPAKVIADFVKANDLDTLEFKGGVIDNKVSSVDEIKKIATLPSRDEMLAKMLGSLNAPISNFACVINAIKEQKESA